MNMRVPNRGAGVALGEGGARGGVAFEVGGRPGLGVPSRGVEYGWLVVGRVERGAFASGLSGFGVVPVHPPLPLRGAEIQNRFGAWQPHLYECLVDVRREKILSVNVVPRS